MQNTIIADYNHGQNVPENLGYISAVMDEPMGLNQMIQAAEEIRHAAHEATRETKLETAQKTVIGMLTIEEQRRQHQRLERESQPPKKSRDQQTHGRIHRISTQLTDAENELFRARVQLSGMSQAELIRVAVLNETFEVRSITNIDEEALNTLMSIAVDLTHICGAIRELLSTNSWENDCMEKVSTEIRELDMLRRKIETEVQKIYGNI